MIACSLICPSTSSTTIQQRRLPSAVLTNERDYFSTIDVQVDTFQDACIAERLRDLGKRKQRHQRMTAINRFIFFQWVQLTQTAMIS
jgi:hypothetical protein